jgi:hypothetical protein
MKKLAIFAGLVALLVVLPISAYAADLYVDDDITCDGNSPCYAHPQDAVNAATDGDTISVYPGTYGTRNFPCPWPPNCSCSDDNAPALIVYVDNLTIEAVDADPASTVIESTHQCWSNTMVVKESTDDNVDSIAAPNGVSVIASGVTIEGFTLRSEYIGDPNVIGDWPNTAGIMIGALYAGDQTHLGVTDTTVKNCIIFGHSGIYNWRSSNTTIDGNSITIIPAAPAATEHNGNGIAVWDGWFEGTYPPTSTGVQILNNNIDTCNVDLSLGDEGKGIMFGGTDSPYPSGDAADQSNMLIDGNTICAASTGIKFWNSIGTNKLITCDNTITYGDGFYRVHDYGVDEGYPPSTWTDLYPFCQDGTGTPGYWMNHPEAWPFDEITIGGETYSKAEAIEWMLYSSKQDVTCSMFQALVAAKLNVLIGNDDSCIALTILAADAWMAANGPVGSGVRAGGKDSPWRIGAPLFSMLQEYNNGLLCAPHRS